MKKSPFKKPDFKEFLKRQQAKAAERKAKLKEKEKEKREKAKLVLAKRKERAQEKKREKGLPDVLKEICHTFIRQRDSFEGEKNRGVCCSCGKIAEGAKFQAGHYVPSASGGVLLRYHPMNIHGQCFACNCSRYKQEDVKTEYARFMVKKYGLEGLERLKMIRSSTSLRIKADKYFYETMIELYKEGDQKEIENFLFSYL